MRRSVSSISWERRVPPKPLIQFYSEPPEERKGGNRGVIVRSEAFIFLLFLLRDNRDNNNKRLLFRESFEGCLFLWLSPKGVKFEIPFQATTTTELRNKN